MRVKKQKRETWYLEKTKQNQRDICHVNLKPDEPPQAYGKLSGLVSLCLEQGMSGRKMPGA